MISIRKFIASENRETAEAFERMAYRLVQSIGLHAVEGDHADLEEFRATIAEVQSSLELDPTPEKILVATGSAVEALQSYNRRASMFVGAKSAELKAIVGMLTQAMSQITLGSQNSITRLQELHREIEQAVVLEDMRAVKTRLSDCLESIRNEVTRQRDESSRAIADLEQGLRQNQPAKPCEAVAAVAADRDPVTDLPQRPAAEAAIAVACEAGSHTYAGLFILDRIQSINSRFGQSLGDQTLVFFLKHLSQALRPADRLYRWNDSSFLALLERPEAAGDVRKEMARALNHRTEHTFNIGSRSVTLPVSSTWFVSPLFEQRFSENVQKLDGFCDSPRRT
jgi:GGDEF domain-containing protein